MPIYLDDQAVDIEGDDLATVLGAARDQLASAGRVVVEVAMDGQTLDADVLEQQEQIPVPSDADVRLYTADPVQLATETLEQVRAALAHADDLQSEAADLLQQDATDEALGKVGEAVEIWLQVQQAVLHAALLAGVELDELTVDDEPVSGFTDELIDRLNSLKDSIEHQDTVGLADALGYEWPAIVQRWDRLIAELIQQIKTQGAPR